MECCSLLLLVISFIVEGGIEGVDLFFFWLCGFCIGIFEGLILLLLLLLLVVVLTHNGGISSILLLFWKGCCG